VSSPPGQGACFVLRLPLRPGDLASDAAEAWAGGVAEPDGE
jgi:hypothetical protein